MNFFVITCYVREWSWRW